MIVPIAFVHGSISSVLVFTGLCAAILLAFWLSALFSEPLHSSKTRIAIKLFSWITAYCISLAGIVYSGILGRAFIPLGPLFLVGTFSVAVAVGFTSLGTRIEKTVPLAFLVGFQGFRLPLELILHDWYASGTIPETMTWTGSNWDIVTGILACLSCAFVTNRQWIAWLVNIVGIALLANVARVAIMSSPVPFGWNVEPPLELILYLPYAFIVPICVGGAAFGHVLLTRRLLGY